MKSKYRNQEIEMTKKTLKDEFGIECKLFRPPQGTLSLSQLLYCRKNNIRTVMWSLDSDDFKIKDAQILVDKTSGNCIKNGEIVLFHDDNEFTVLALPVIIKNLRDRGFGFSTVEEMLK
jgi:peptidoglycan/xylan/chitin deacetylase (PgdA/CDA1 family)